MEVTAVQSIKAKLKAKEAELGTLYPMFETWVNEALKLEKQQIIDAWVQGYTEGYNDTHTIAEDYYNDHYGKAN